MSTESLKTCEFPYNKDQQDCLTAKADWFGHFLDTAELERPAEEVPLARCGNWTFLAISCMVLKGIESCMSWERFEETTSLLQTSLKAGWTSGSCSASIIHGS